MIFYYRSSISAQFWSILYTNVKKEFFLNVVKSFVVGLSPREDLQEVNFRFVSGSEQKFAWTL